MVASSQWWWKGEPATWNVERSAHILISPYGGPIYLDFCELDSVILVAGGSGFTYANATLQEVCVEHFGSSRRLNGECRSSGR